LDARSLIVAAVDLEVRLIRSQLADLVREETEKGRAWSGKWKGTPVLLVTTGIGPERARRVLAPLVRKNAVQRIFSIGYAGALRDGIQVGDLLIPREIRMDLGGAGNRFNPDPALFESACRTALKRGWPFSTDPMVTTDHVVASEPEKRRLGTRCDAGSVEMESAVVAELAEQASLPFVTVRVALDTVEFALPDVSQFLRLWRQRRWGSLLVCGARDPSSLVRLIRVWRYTRYASDRLTGFLGEYFSDRSHP
jgi:adenosylhomocysteine nucleosidase